MSSRIRLPSISFVVARSYPHNIIGRDNKLPWHQRTDLQRFKQITLGHVVIMGRTTFDSIGRPLPGRTNVILSKRPPNNSQMSIWDTNDTSLLWSQNHEDALYLGDIISLATDRREVFIIGGDQMYRLYGRLCNRIHLTQIFSPMKPKPGDAVFDFDLDGRTWRTLEEKEVAAGPHDDHASRYSVLDRKWKTVRYVEIEDFYTDRVATRRWIASQVGEIEATVAKGELPHTPKQLHLFEEQEVA